ncbi:DNA-binding response regulator [Paenibacillus glycanilyticus]|uniref:DNA-binding response regulator n=1 Tax=Paenibacillus glycanilyticus TaxID=126569 RepID=A0ABQ6GDB7_9BACL|nr:DNA-binding response regulator [Paenibacillus glycanilyticus]GLX68270.1 hypothetical protein MU1_26150 [Paenibacillus glycanilyticus]
MSYEEVFNSWYEDHLKRRNGENKRRLAEGVSHEGKLFLDKVWWPAFLQFDHLYPEFELIDFREGRRYLDFAYVDDVLRLAIEVDGYNTHAAGVSRWQFSDNLARQNHLVIDGWDVLRFSYDDVKDKPRICIQTLQQYFGSRLGRPRTDEVSADEILEAEILKYAMRLGRPLRPIDVRAHLQIGEKRTRTLLHSMLANNKLLKHGSGEKRVRCYIVNNDKLK